MYRKRSNRNKKNLMVLFEAKNGTEFIVFDTETTGLKPEFDYIVELAAQKYKVIDNRCGKVEKIEELHIYMKPPFFMDQSVINVHHITNEFLSDKPTESEIFPVIKEFFSMKAPDGSRRPPIVLGYNVQFDISMLSALYKRQGEELTTRFVMDILEMSRDLVTPKEIETFLKAQYTGEDLNERLKKPYQLGNLVRMYGLDSDITFHSAIDDTEATSRLLRCYYGEYKKQPESGKGLLSINFTYYFKGYNKDQQGVWVDTHLGKVFFSTFYKSWMSAMVDLNTVDIDRFEKDVLDKLGGISLEELGKMTEKKYNTLKDDLKKKRVSA